MDIQRMTLNKESKILFWALLLSFSGTTAGYANVNQIKAYKAAFPDEKPKCTYCHAVEKPKKPEGEHDLNDYGKKIKALNAVPTAETYKQIGVSSEKEKGK